MRARSWSRGAVSTNPPNLSKNGRRIRFEGGLELDPQAYALRLAGRAVKLERIPMELLLLLVEHKNELVSREQIVERVWGKEVFLDTDNSINAAVRKIRQVLKDNPEQPRFLQTVTGRGYRFIAALEEPAQAEKVPVSGESTSVILSAATVAPLHKKPVGWKIAAGFVIVLIIGGTGYSWWAKQQRPSPVRLLSQRRLTGNGPEFNVVSAAISPNGKYLGFSDRLGIHLQTIETNEKQDVPAPGGLTPATVFWEFRQWFPDSTRFLARLAEPGMPISLWSVPVIGGPPQKIIEDITDAYGVSPDGLNILFTRASIAMGEREIWIMSFRGESPHKLRTADDNSGFQQVVWSQNGNTIAYALSRRHGATVDNFVESCDLNGANVKRLLSDSGMEEFAWLAPNRIVYSRRAKAGTDYYSDNLWELLVNNDGMPQGQPYPLTDWSGFWINNLSSSADGKRLTFLRGNSHETVFVGDWTKSSAALVNVRRLTADDFSSLPLAWTLDSREVVFSSKRGETRQIYKQSIDSNDSPHLLTIAPASDFYIGRLSPDGSSLLVEGESRATAKMGLYRVGMDGGIPQLLFETEGMVDFRCTERAVNFCVFGLMEPDQNFLTISTFDPVRGKGEELLKIPVQSGARYNWALSPDGAQLGILARDWNMNTIRLFPVHGGSPRTIATKGYSNLRSLDWSSDSKSIFVGTYGPSGAILLRVDLRGNVVAVWRQPQPLNTWVIPSPDGKHVLIYGTSAEANVWMIDDF
jgi:DNA-binding winged helix-turn-helix (wHTH) protein/Tol biopolymer transport system component